MKRFSVKCKIFGWTKRKKACSCQGNSLPEILGYFLYPQAKKAGTLRVLQETNRCWTFEVIFSEWRRKNLNEEW